MFVRSADYVDALASSSMNAGIADHNGVSLDERCKELVDTTSVRRRFVYSAVVVGIYGSFEAYVEELVMAYLEALDSLCPTIQDFPKAVQKRHVDASANLLLNREMDKYKERCDVEEVVQRLTRANARRGERRINELAFIEHRSNFWAETLGDFFKDAGVPDLLQRLKTNAEVRKYLSDVEGLDGIERLSNSVVFRDLDDLAQRRNEVAHGAVGSILSGESILTRVDFMEVLGAAILAETEDEYVKYLVDHGVVRLPRPLAVYRNRIACFELTMGAVETGCRIVSRSTSGELRHGKVIRIEVDGAALPSVSAPPTVRIGMELDFVVHDTYEFFLERR